jgi:hypothetical protein
MACTTCLLVSMSMDATNMNTRLLHSLGVENLGSVLFAAAWRCNARHGCNELSWTLLSYIGRDCTKLRYAGQPCAGPFYLPSYNTDMSKHKLQYETATYHVVRDQQFMAQLVATVQYAAQSFQREFHCAFTDSLATQMAKADPELPVSESMADMVVSG